MISVVVNGDDKLGGRGWDLERFVCPGLGVGSV